jgi:4-hydroxyphenylacetate 3-monooxygenase
MLGEMIDVIETLRAFLRAAEVDPFVDDQGFSHPNLQVMNTARNYFPRIYPRLVEILQLIGSSGLMATPTERDLEQAAIHPDIDRYFQSATLNGADRVQLFRLAWDIACSSFGGRQVLYERFFAGDLNVLLAGRFLGYDRSAPVERVRTLLARSAAQPTGR